MKKLKCKICDCEFVPEKKSHYIARTDGKTGVVSMFQSNDETGLFDAFDCPQCGCQVIAQERKRAYIVSNVDDAEDGDEEEMVTKKKQKNQYRHELLKEGYHQKVRDK